MAIPHAVPGQPIDVRPLGAQILEARTVALFKSYELEVMRLVLPAGKSVPPHAVPGEITVHCIEGKIKLLFEDRVQVLEAGQLLYLGAGVEHSLVGMENASALVTIALHK
jgi:quercetin dioxygenase-like cupin family protein